MTHLNGLKAHRPQQNTDVGEFINSKLREIDQDPVQPPYDSLQEYAYEGEGSMYGSTLSSLDVRVEQSNETPIKQPVAASTTAAPANNNSNRLSTFSSQNRAASEHNTADDELDQIKNWGPKFNKISDIYGLKSSNDES